MKIHEHLYSYEARRERGTKATRTAVSRDGRARRRNQRWLDRERFLPGWNGSRQALGNLIRVCGVFLPKGRGAGRWWGTLEIRRGDGVILWKAEINKAKSLEIRQDLGGSKGGKSTRPHF